MEPSKDRLELLVARLDERLSVLLVEVADIKASLERSYVTRDEFEPVKKLAYGTVALALSTLLLAAVAVVLKTGAGV
ncbi:MAG: hypothetical protein GY716_16155 [bacterium]|nr:hypothetical protein [bacterium]